VAPSIGEEEIPVLVQPAHVAVTAPAAVVEELARLAGIAVVLEGVDPFEVDGARLPNRNFTPLIVEYVRSAAQ
jgi:hypothetical protein